MSIRELFKRLTEYYVIVLLMGLFVLQFYWMMRPEYVAWAMWGICITGILAVIWGKNR